MVKANQAGNATWSPVSSTKVIVVGLPYDAVAIASLDGAARTDGTIRVGDDLSIRVSAADADVTSCRFDMVLSGPGSMAAAGELQPDGSCTVDLVLPQPVSYTGPDGVLSLNDLELCIQGFYAQFSDGTFTSNPDPAARRVMALEDRAQPAGNSCESGSTEQAPEVLDFKLATGGNPRPFSSTPTLLSWNPNDWDPDFVQLRFNTIWEVHFPAWVAGCNAPYVNGSWVALALGDFVEDGACQPWSLTLPGVLPTTVPDNPPLTLWPAQLIFRYLDDRGQLGVTSVHQDVPFDGSDGVFSASSPAIFPTDVGVSRFVDAGTTWQPRFQVTGATPASCKLTLYINEQAPDYPEYVAPVDGDGVCAFSLGPFELYSDRPYHVEFDDGTHNGVFSGFIEAIQPSTAPSIPDPTLGTSGTSFAANPGAGQGLSLEVSVAAQGGGTAALAPSAATPATASGPVCSATTWSATLATGGGLASAIAKCGYIPGTYVVTARMVDAAGVVRTRTRTITLAPDTKKPTTSVPSIRFRSSVALTGSSLPIRVSWTAADTGGAGLARYELGRSTNGGSTWTVLSTSLTAPSFDTTVASNGTVRYRVRAVDRAGNHGAWVSGPTTSARLRQESAAAFTYSTSWKHATYPAFSGGAAKYASRAGAFASYTFTGRAIALVTTQAPSRGKVKVYVDGKYATTIDAYAPSVRWRAVVWQRSWASAGTHTVRFVVIGTSARPRFDLDAVLRL